MHMKFLLVFISWLSLAACSRVETGPWVLDGVSSNQSTEAPSPLLRKWFDFKVTQNMSRKENDIHESSDKNKASIYLIDLVKVDSELRTLRVKMFPINPPFGDPYPKTENIWQSALINKEGLSIKNKEGKEIVFTTKVEFQFKRKYFKANGKRFPLEEVSVNPATSRPTRLIIDEHRFSQVDVTLKGFFSVRSIADTPLKWQIINHIGLEDYVASATSSEAIHHFEYEALKAQAIAIRTYVLHEMIRARFEKNRDWDVSPTTTFQSYRGVKWNHTLYGWQEIENEVARRATLETESQVILYDNKIIKSYFHSNSGGKTCAAIECLRTKENLPYLQVVKDAYGVRNAPMGTWGRMKPLDLSKAHLILKKFHIGKKADRLVKLSTLRKSSSGRVFQFRAHFSNGKKTLLTQDQSEEIMRLFGSVRSYYFELSEPDQKGFQYVTGFGYGHGVGLSQWGAHLYAKQGWDAQKIISHYFPGTELRGL